MRTLAAVVFIAGVAVVAVVIARRPTVADGRVLAADLVEAARRGGVAITDMRCEPRIPIGTRGAMFLCTATLDGGATQEVEYTLTPAGDYEAKPRAVNYPPQPRKPASGDPWDNRP